MHRAVFGAIALWLSACYRYSPSEPLAVRPGAAVRFELTAPGAARLAPVLGAGTTAVEGTVLAASDTGYRIAMSATRKASSSDRIGWAGEQVALPRDAVERVELRALDRRRTLGVAALALLGAVAVKVLINSFDALAGGDDGGGTPTPP